MIRHEEFERIPLKLEHRNTTRLAMSDAHHLPLIIVETSNNSSMVYTGPQIPRALAMLFRKTPPHTSKLQQYRPRDFCSISTSMRL